MAKFAEQYEQAVNDVKEQGGEIEDYLDLPKYVCKDDCGCERFTVNVDYDATARVDGYVPGTITFNADGDEDEQERDEYEFTSSDNRYEDIEIEDYSPDYDEDDLKCEDCDEEVLCTDGMSAEEVMEELNIVVAEKI